MMGLRAFPGEGIRSVQGNHGEATRENLLKPLISSPWKPLRTPFRLPQQFSNSAFLTEPSQILYLLSLQDFQINCIAEILLKFRLSLTFGRVHEENEEIQNDHVRGLMFQGEENRGLMVFHGEKMEGAKSHQCEEVSGWDGSQRINSLRGIQSGKG
jgi:hypothetical protein